MFLDNADGIALRSDTLASVLTERPACVRLLGATRMVPLNSTAFIAITGNGLSVTEDLARRFILCELDARCEDPELRLFQAGFFLSRLNAPRRTQLLAAALTIWRFGRQNAAELTRGSPFGSFECSVKWCRDSVARHLGCRDPVERVDACCRRPDRSASPARILLEVDAGPGGSITAPLPADRQPTRRRCWKGIALIRTREVTRQYLATLYSPGLLALTSPGFVLASRRPRRKSTRYLCPRPAATWG